MNKAHERLDREELIYTLMHSEIYLRTAAQLDIMKMCDVGTIWAYCKREDYKDLKRWAMGKGPMPYVYKQYIERCR